MMELKTEHEAGAAERSGAPQGKSCAGIPQKEGSSADGDRGEGERVAQAGEENWELQGTGKTDVPAGGRCERRQ